MKHKIHTIWTSDQMRRIQTKNMKIIHNNKEKCINFDKKISWRSFFTACFSWMNKRRKSTIVFWYMIHKTNHKHTIHEDRKSTKHCCSWTTYEHEHELDFDHDQKSHHKTWYKYEDFEIFSVAEKYCNKTTSVSSLRVSVKLSAHILITVKNNQTNTIKQCKSQKAFFKLVMKLYEAMLIKLIRTIRLTQSSIFENSLDQTVFFVD